jgi:hypothetical protein
VAEDAQISQGPSPQLFHQQATAQSRVAMREKNSGSGAPSPGRLLDNVKYLALGLIKLGLQEDKMP